MKKNIITEAIQYHKENNIPYSEPIFRYGSVNFFKYINELRKLNESKQVKLDSDALFFVNSDLGKIGIYEGKEVLLDFPMIETINEADYKGKSVDLNSPKRGGSKKFYVYVRSDAGNVKKISFGDTTGLTSKIKDPEARKAFSARHQCDKKKDKTKAGYWACNLPRYWDKLGGGSKINGYW